MPALKDLKPVQQKELTALFESQQEAPAAAVVEVSTPQDQVREEREEPSPSRSTTPKPTKVAATKVIAAEFLDFSDPVAFIEKVPTSFFDDMNSSNWKVRKEALEILLPLVSHPKLVDGRYFELLNVLAKKVQDPNVLVANLSIQCIEKLAFGLAKNFSQYKSIVS